MAKAPSIFENAVAFSLAMFSFGNRRKVPSRSVETDADRSWVSVSKRLIDSSELKDIKACDREFYTWLKTRALPSMFRRGIWMIPLDLIEQVDNKLAVYRTERAALVDLFIAAYAAQAKESKDALGSLYNETDYPSVERMRAFFFIEAQYVEFSTPQNLKGIKRGMLQREKDNLAAQCNNALDGMRNILRAGLSELLTHVTGRLEVGDDGRPKIIRKTMLDKLNDFVSVFDAKNTITNDAELRDLVARVRDVNSGITGKQLQTDTELRAIYAKEITALSAEASTMVADAPERAFLMDDDD